MKETLRSKIIYLFVIGGILGLFCFWYFSVNNKLVEVEISQVETLGTDNDSNKIVLHISGEVMQPGIIELEAGARVIDALDASGGITLDGDLEGLNLARKVKDEEKIIVSKIGDSIRDNAQINNKLININTANVDELKSLPGIGEVLAKGIVDYREKNGNYTQLDDLKNVSRIGEKLFENIVSLITL
ncbi:MAG: helix-hairpin-helix domain-containing protein [Eubacteriaceae bacterium]